jgi:hypothetical protein
VARNAVLRWLAGAPSTATWTVRFAAANLLAVFLTTVMVTKLVDSDTWSSQAIYLGLAVVVAGLSAYLLALTTSIRESRFPQYPEVVLEMLREISTAMRLENSRPVAMSAEGVRASAIADLKLYLRALEDVLADAWSQKRFGDRTDIEVVLMNRASDGYVTVAAWANNRPLSLDRRVDVPTFYDKTEAAILYRNYGDVGTRAPIHILPDISKHPGYDHFGRDPRLRTNSSALFPLYDTESKLHGFVAVTARRRTNLFREEDRQFWTEVWALWEPHILRQVLRYEATGAPFGEQVT